MELQKQSQILCFGRTMADDSRGWTRLTEQNQTVCRFFRQTCLIIDGCKNVEPYERIKSKEKTDSTNERTNTLICVLFFLIGTVGGDKNSPQEGFWS